MEMEFLGSPETWDEDVHPDENNPPEVKLPPLSPPPVKQCVPRAMSRSGFKKVQLSFCDCQ